MNNGVLEGINSLVTMCYIIAGKLDFSNTY
jgi:hypothetical protein